VADTATQVSYAPSEETELIRSTTRQWLQDRLPTAVVREMMMSDEGFDRGLWKEFANLGWTGLAVGEVHGGAGYGFKELGVVLEEMGRLVTPGPFFASVVLATTAIQEIGTDEQMTDLLPGLALGDQIATLAAFEQPRGWDLSGTETRASKAGDDWVLTGSKKYVLDGHLADLILVVADVGGGLGVFVVDSDAPGVEIRQIPVLDPTRRQAEISFTDVHVPSSRFLGGAPADKKIARVLSLSVAAMANEQVGGAQRCLDMSVEYAKSRYQFGRPIGSYQAIKHRCAEMLMKVEHACTTAYHAVRVTDDGAELAVASPLAGSIASEAYVWAAGETIQIHGGIGFTWEHDAHLYLKRAKASSLLFGDPRYQRDRLGVAIGL
jgi:alkylation response protein AidB-like acyl-CoA dehydrogenase